MAKPKTAPSVVDAAAPKAKSQRHGHANIMVLIMTALIAGGISYAEIAQPSLPLTKTANAPEQQQTTQTATKQSEQSEPKTNMPTVDGSPSASTTKSTTNDEAASSTVASSPAVKTATTVSFVNMRAGKSTSTPIVAELDGGTIVQLRDDADPTWQGVTYNGKVGYIYKEYLHY